MGVVPHLVIALALSAVAHAQSAEVDPFAAAESHDEEARALFQAGRRAFADARYEDALDRFRSAYELSHRPELLYNIGHAADRLRRDARPWMRSSGTSGRSLTSRTASKFRRGWPPFGGQ
jgi:tetratricopeptide (TPR) repeat protein